MQRPQGSVGEVFAAFLKLGVTAFGGPIAHLGYFRGEFVLRRRWLDEAEFADLLALCQFLPGPASSQVGFSLGLLRAGFPGALAAWTAFTLPSALLLILFAAVQPALTGPLASGALHGLKLVAVAVVAQAVLGMARTLAPDLARVSIAVGAALLVTLVGEAASQLAAIGAGCAFGLLLCRSGSDRATAALNFPVARGTGVAALVVFLVLLVGTPLAASVTGMHALALFDAFYRAGALVFGGGHVVLPLLQAEIVPRGWIGTDAFLAGYGAAQAVPGPLFTFAAYLGTAMEQRPDGVSGAALCLAAVFLPGLLLVTGTLPFWDRLRLRPNAQAAMRGANAAVVGVLAAALYNPVWVSAVIDWPDIGLAVLGVGLLVGFRMPPWVVVILLVAGGTASSILHPESALAGARAYLANGGA